jgi:hypothetical protein
MRDLGRHGMCTLLPRKKVTGDWLCGWSAAVGHGNGTVGIGRALVCVRETSCDIVTCTGGVSEC